MPFVIQIYAFLANKTSILRHDFPYFYSLNSTLKICIRVVLRHTLTFLIPIAFTWHIQYSLFFLLSKLLVQTIFQGDFWLMVHVPTHEKQFLTKECHSKLLKKMFSNSFYVHFEFELGKELTDFSLKDFLIVFSYKNYKREDTYLCREIIRS